MIRTPYQDSSQELVDPLAMEGYNQTSYNQYPSTYPSQTVVVVNQPQAPISALGQPQNIRDWSSGMCGCFEDCCGCMYCFFCNPCFMCDLARRQDECCMGPCCCRELFVIPMRTKLRTQYGIRGSIFKDCCEIWFCYFCATHQMYRELKSLNPLL